MIGLNILCNSSHLVDVPIFIWVRRVFVSLANVAQIGLSTPCNIVIAIYALYFEAKNSKLIDIQKETSSQMENSH